MFIHDTAAVTSHDVTPEGFLRLHARIGRAGLHDYAAAELGAPAGFAPGSTIRVWRPPEEVFDPSSMASFAGKPVTDDHPPAMIDAANWRRYAVGHAGEAVTREGDHLATVLHIADADAAARARAGAELSNGYHADFVFEPGTTPDGEPYDAVQRNIRGNHVALVDAGRCGATCGTAVKARDCGCDGVVDAATLDARVEERATVLDAARHLLGSAFEPQGRSTAAIRRIVAERRLGAGRLEGRDDAYVAAAFDTLLALEPSGRDPLAAHLTAGAGSRDGALAARHRYLSDAWKGAASA